MWVSSNCLYFCFSLTTPNYETRGFCNTPTRGIVSTMSAATRRLTRSNRKTVHYDESSDVEQDQDAYIPSEQDKENAPNHVTKSSAKRKNSVTTTTTTNTTTSKKRRTGVTTNHPRCLHQQQQQQPQSKKRSKR